MANSKFIITFLAMPTINDELRILENELFLNLKEIFKPSRLAQFQTKIPASYDIGTEGAPEYVFSGYVSQNYKAAFDLDYNSTGLFTVTATTGEAGSGLGTVTVEANYPGAVFFLHTVPFGIEVEIFNEAPGTFISIDNVGFSESETNPCQNVNVNVETSVLATRIVSSIPIIPPTEASSNLLLYSNDLSNSAWTKTRVNLSGTKVIPNTEDASHHIQQIIDKDAVAGNYTFSFYGKAAELNVVDVVGMRIGGSGQSNTAFDFNAGIVFFGYSFAGITYVGHSIEDAGDGYFRASITLTLPADSQVLFNISVRGTAGYTVFPGNDVDGIYLERFQFNNLGLLPYLETTNTALDVELSDGTIIDPNTENPFQINVPRATSFTLTVENSEGNTDTETINSPSLLNQQNFNISFNNSPNGATVTIINENSEGLDIEYSLDGDTWQSSNVFPGLEPGDYTLHVRDQLGCSFTMDFTVSDSNFSAPYFYLSKSNSIRLAQRITWGDAANYKTDENTLSCEAEVGVPYHEVQLFQTADIITTQFKSNYLTKTAKVIRSDNSEDIVPIIQKSNNIGLKSKLDAKKYSLGGGKIGVYFISGNTYDYDTGLSNGVHFLNGTLPEWGLVGNYVNISGTWYFIESTFFDEDKSADVLVLTDNYSGAEVNVVAGCIYNIKNYEVFEFSIDMVDYINEVIKVKLENSDPNFGTITHLSEDISVLVRHNDTLDINYWNDDNNDVFYASGIRHRIRIPYTRIEGMSEEEIETYKTDTNTKLLGAQVYEGDKYVFEPITKEMWRKLIMALSHKNVYINGVQYVKTGKFETEGPLDDSNLYVLTAAMIKAGEVYNSDGSTFTNQSVGQVPLPGLLEGDTGFIGY